MSMETADQAVEHLYFIVRGTKYTPASHWSTTRTFTPSYQKINTEFVLDKTLVPPKGIEPLFPRS
jgi:hypothetical protein